MAWQRDNPQAVVERLESGPFALETHTAYIAQRIREIFSDDSPPGLSRRYAPSGSLFTESYSLLKRPTVLAAPIACPLSWLSSS